MGFYFHNKSELNRVVLSHKSTEDPFSLVIFLRREGEVVYSDRFAFCDFI